MNFTATIDDLLEVLIDYRGKTPPKTTDGVRLITAKVIKDGRITSDRQEFIAAETYDAWMRRGLPQTGDVLITTEAPLGEVAQVGRDAHIALAQRVILLRPNAAAVDPQFFFHFLRSPVAQERLRQRSSGTTVSGIRQPELRAIQVDLLPRKSQEVVSAVLDALDGHIENNRRQIEVLEEMAQGIYREWFVHYRYPGHEDATFVDSPLGPIPDDWTVRQLTDVATLVRGRSYRKRELSEDDGLPFVNLKCMMRGGGFRVDGLKRYTGIYKPDQVVEHGDIVLAVTDLTQGREILAQATLIPRLDEERSVISLDVARIVPIDDRERLPLYFALRCTDFADRVKEFANGSTVLHLSPKYVEQNTLIWPEQSLQRQFTELATPMIVILDDLRQSADRLVAMRDLLLPKLVTGEIDVSDLDLESSVEVV